jgi:hypothetical protein
MIQIKDKLKNLFSSFLFSHIFISNQIINSNKLSEMKQKLKHINYVMR